jgi:DNA-binding FadR family transcriptional regulator
MPKLIALDLANDLRRRIGAGDWRSAGRLPPERELAERFGIARNTVRHAISLLEAEGVVSRQIGRGTFILGTGGNGEAASAAAWGAANEISPKDLIDARLLIEPAAAAAAAANATESDIAELERIQSASAATQEMETFELHDAAIHRRLFAMSQNQLILRIAEMLEAMRANADWLSAKRHAYSPELKARYVAQHADIIAAIRRRSPKAAREAMTAHLEEVRRALLEL